MEATIHDKITLNNGYKIPNFYFGPTHPVTEKGFINDGSVTGSNKGFVSTDGCTASFDEVVQTALDMGIRGFDSGARYGTEEDLGRIFRTCGIPRDELFITTKVNNKMQGYDNTMIDFENSMKALGLDYVDIYMIHCPVPVKGLYVETWKAFEEIYKSGRAKAIGVSNFTVQHFYDLAEASDIVPAVNQIEQHPFYVQANLKAYEKKHGICSMSYSPLGQGKFARDPRLQWVADKYNKTIAQVILRWHIQKGYIPVTRSTNPIRVKENAEIFDFDISAVDMAYIDTLNHGNRVWHNPDRFPGTAAHVHVEKVFREAIEEELEKAQISDDKKEKIRDTFETLMDSKDVDDTRDWVIWCFTHAEATYGANAAIEEQACEAAKLLANHLVVGLSKQ